MSSGYNPQRIVFVRIEDDILHEGRVVGRKARTERMTQQQMIELMAANPYKEIKELKGRRVTRRTIE